MNKLSTESARIRNHKAVLLKVNSGVPLVEARNCIKPYRQTYTKRGGRHSDWPTYNQHAVGVVNPKTVEAWANQ